jgi:1,4-dihydroxy-2-naphthoate octaprenyltransferase
MNFMNLGTFFGFNSILGLDYFSVPVIAVVEVLLFGLAKAPHHVAVLHANNTRDMENDRKVSGKKRRREFD